MSDEAQKRADIYDFFNYIPSRGITIVALVLFSLATVITLGTTIWTRRWYMLVAVAVGAMELAGFALRLIMLNSPGYGGYVAMQVLLIIPPSFLALVEYITLAKLVELIRSVNPNIKDFLRPKLITWCYFAAEIFSLALQGAGAGLSVNKDEGVDNDNTRGAGRALLLVGLAFLVVVIVCFYANTVYVSVRKEYGVRESRNLRAVVGLIYATATLLLARNVFRLIEFADGWYGSISSQEKYFYGLDALMVVLILFIFGIFNYGFLLNAFEREAANKRIAPETEMV